MSAPPYDRVALVRAIAWMQVRGWANSMLRGLSRDAVPAALGLLLAGASAFVSLGFGFGALVITGFGGDDPFFQFWLAAGLLGSLTLMSTLSGASGESSDLAGARMLQVYPIFRGDLLALDIASQLFAPTLLFFLPAVLGMSAGLTLAHLIAGRVLAALLAAPAMIAGLLCTALVLRVIGSGVIIGGRRVRETLVIGLTVLFLGVTFLGPAAQEDRLDELGKTLSSTSSVVRFLWPGAAADLASGPGLLSGLLDVAVLGTWLAGGWMLHRRFTGRVLDGESGTTTRRVRTRARAPRLFLGPIAGAALADFRTMTRIPVVWIQLVMPGLFGLLLGRSGHSAGSTQEAEIAAAWTPVLAAFGAQVFFTSPLFSNLFGSDHGGAAHYVLAPAPAWRILLGKALSRLSFGAVQVSVFLAAVSFRMDPSEEKLRPMLFAFAAWLAGSLWVAAAGSFISIRLPFRMSHGLQREAGNRVLSSLLGQFLVASVLIPPAMMIMGGRLLRGDTGYLAGIVVTGLAGMIVWVIAAVWCSELWPAWGPRMAEELAQRG